jgi:hypothetical protein
MAYAYVDFRQGADNGSATTIATSTSITPGASSSFFWATTYQHASAQTVSVAGNSNTYTQTASVHEGSVAYGMHCGYVKAANAGATTATATFSASVAERGILLVEYTGLEVVGTIFGAGESVGLYSFAAGTATNAWTSGNITPGAQPAVLIGIGRTINFGTDFAAGTSLGFTGRSSCWDMFGADTAYFEDVRLTSTSVVAATFTRATNGATDGGFVMGLILRELVAAQMLPAMRIRQNTLLRM